MCGAKTLKIAYSGFRRLIKIFSGEAPAHPLFAVFYSAMTHLIGKSHISAKTRNCIRNHNIVSCYIEFTN